MWTPHSLAIKLIGGVAAYKEDGSVERQGWSEWGSNGLNGPLCVMRLMEANTEPLVVRFLANGNLYLLSERAPQCNFIVVVDLSIPVGCCLFPLVGSEVFGICPLRLFQTVHTTVISIDRPTLGVYICQSVSSSLDR